jgi:hypothetical protein
MGTGGIEGVDHKWQWNGCSGIYSDVHRMQLPTKSSPLVQDQHKVTQDTPQDTDAKHYLIASVIEMAKKSIYTCIVK